MFAIWLTTLTGVLRDRVFWGILVVAALLLLIPAASTLSMRQVVELSITLCLSLVSFVLFLLAIFLGAPLLWRDMERRYTYSILGLPLSRSAYLLGKFAAVATFLALVVLALSPLIAGIVHHAASTFPPSRPVLYENIALALSFDLLKYLLLVAIGFLLASVSTSFFLPIFGTICLFFTASVSQEVYDYLQSPAGQNTAPILRESATFLYYLIPNLSAFDLKPQAIYGLPIDFGTLSLTLLYWGVYVGIVLTLAALFFQQREMK